MDIINATIKDYKELHHVRMSVQENKLSDPTKVSFEDYSLMLNERGVGWLCEIEGQVVGFAIADAVSSSIWALFVLPDFEGKGIGLRLHNTMVNWCFEHASLEQLWLSTDPNTRAESFYLKAGWKITEMNEDGEIRFELSKKVWEQRKATAS
ncbi:GNAT family N-acetyltransferase [Nafulsella turpanensis]|uniref:GNAT family N-acetyltransferase n=1 Tax=Nafulsella turpanensis TaxID=1265690 RepID=UPI00037F0AC5|nr:GNAT family N-acetyltransferase [Nafulsella turpanensis]